VHNKQVSFNYRLGLFGHYTHPDLSSEDAAAGGAGVCGNYSLLDQVSSSTLMLYELHNKF
jgi:carboxylesterase type B